MTAEQAVLGSMLVAQDAAEEGLDTLQPQHFQGHVEAAIFRAMQRCREQHKAIDLVTVQAALTETGVLDEVGGIPYLVELGQMVPTAANIGSYAKQVREEYNRRKLVQGMTTLLTQAAQTTPQEMAAGLALLAQQVDSGVDAQDRSIKSIAVEEHAAIMRRADGKDKPLDTGIKSLDRITGGMTNGEFWIIGARPSVGKSTLAFQLSEYVVQSGKTALFFSAEMSRSMIAQRLFAQKGFSTYHSRHPENLEEQDWDRLADGLKRAQELEHLYVDTKTDGIPEIRAVCRQQQAHGGLDLVVLDYLQILRAAQRKESRNIEVASISADLKRLAKDLDVPVVALSQLSRAGAYGDKPTLAHLRDSGAIEQDADVAVLMYRLEGEEFENTYGPVREWLEQKGNSIVRMDVAKNRNGSLGTVDMMLIGAQSRFAPPITFIEEDKQEAFYDRT